MIRCAKCNGRGTLSRIERTAEAASTSCSFSTCDACCGYGEVSAPNECHECGGTGTVQGPRSEGPRRLELPGACPEAEEKLVVTEIVENDEQRLLVRVWWHPDINMTVTIDADAERQLYELLRLRAEQGPPREGT